jgi:carbamoyl-phosphate synthase small subunit
MAEVSPEILPAVHREPLKLGPHLLALGITIAVILLLIAGMWWGWHRRGRRQADIAAPQHVPEVLPDDLVDPVDGLVLGTTVEGNWLERVVPHGLSARHRATLRVTGGGIALGDWWLPARLVRGVRLDSRHAGKVMGEGGVLVIAWQPEGTDAAGFDPPASPDRILETGFRADDRAAHPGLLTAVRHLLPAVASRPEPAQLGEVWSGLEAARSAWSGTGEREIDAPVESPLLPVPLAAVASLSPRGAVAAAEEPVLSPPLPLGAADPPPPPAGDADPLESPEPEPAESQQAAEELEAAVPQDEQPTAEAREFDPLDPLTVPLDLLRDFAPLLSTGQIPGLTDPVDLVGDDLVGPVEVSEGDAGEVPEPPVTPAAPRVNPALIGLARPPAVLVLEDGRVFRGDAFGAPGEITGEAVFATGMTGYQETLTDPSYHRQVVMQTSPHIGNTGINDEDNESGRIWVAGYVVRDNSRLSSSWRARRGLEDELRDQGVVGISGIDTRALTRHLRERGAMRVAISSTEQDTQALLQRVQASPSMAGLELASEVSTTEPYVVPSATGETRMRVVALDLGIKARTPYYLAQRGIEVHVMPARTSATELLARDPDGVFLSNGPGDPAATSYAHDTVRALLGAAVPLFGICLGNQVLGHALGLGTTKLRYGHRGINQPVLDRSTGRVEVTAHNHGFAVQAPESLQENVNGQSRPGAGTFETPFGRAEVSHLNLNDGVVEGLRCLDVPAFSVQYHPEAAAGPHDSVGLFDAFVRLMEDNRAPAH